MDIQRWGMGLVDLVVGILEIRGTRSREGNVMPRATQDVFLQMTSLGLLPLEFMGP